VWKNGIWLTFHGHVCAGTYGAASDPKLPTAPAFSMKGRPKDRNVTVGPGPGAYTTPGALSTKAASLKGMGGLYGIGCEGWFLLTMSTGRPKDTVHSQSPGPVYSADISSTRKVCLCSFAPLPQVGAEHESLLGCPIFLNVRTSQRRGAKRITRSRYV
jgi:hypothetical protein